MLEAMKPPKSTPQKVIMSVWNQILQLWGILGIVLLFGGSVKLNTNLGVKIMTMIRFRYVYCLLPCIAMVGHSN